MTSVELRRRLCLTSIPAMLVQRRLRWFGHATRRPEGELIKELLLPTPPTSSELAQDRRALGASVRDVVIAIGGAGSTRPG